VTDCAKCGSCCEKIWLNADPRRWSAAALEGIPDPRTEDGWAYWLEHSEYADADRSAAIRRYNPDGAMRADADFIAAHFTEDCDGYWACDAYDPEHGTCTAHEDRPPLCSGFPWYGEQPSVERADRVHRECSYLADLPPGDRPEGSRPLIPLTVI
jgi:Fe-S-cluster containining protein